MPLVPPAVGAGSSKSDAAILPGWDTAAGTGTAVWHPCAPHLPGRCATALAALPYAAIQLHKVLHDPVRSNWHLPASRCCRCRPCSVASVL